MSERVHYHEGLIFSVGTQVVTLVDIPGAGGLIRHPRGTVGVVIKSPTDQEHSYRVRFGDGLETPLRQSEITMLARFKEGEIGDNKHAAAPSDLYQRVIYRCVIGSQAYGLACEKSDVDRRGISCRPPNCTGRSTACQSNWKTTKRKKRTGNSRSSSCWPSRPTRMCWSACTRH